MRVVTVCEYLAASSRAQGHWAAFKFVRAIKTEEFTRYAYVPVNGTDRYLTVENRDEALVWAGQMLAPYVKQAFGPALITLVPIPGSQCTSPADVTNGRVHKIAENVARHMMSPAVTVKPLLWWDQPMPRSHHGGGRDPADLAPHYVVQKPGLLDTLPELVLIDDVLTHAGHFRSAAARLRAAGWRVADTAFAVARTVWSGEGVTRPASEQAFSAVYEDFPPWP